MTHLTHDGTARLFFILPKTLGNGIRIVNAFVIFHILQSFQHARLVLMMLLKIHRCKLIFLVFVLIGPVPTLFHII